MDDIRELYGAHVAEWNSVYGEESDHFWAPSDYTPLLESIAPIALQKDEEDYQGSSFVLYRDGARWGYLAFGWGSCSGCDALQGCESWNEVAELRQELNSDVYWEPDATAMLRWIVNRNWVGDWSWSSGTHRTFLVDAVALLAVEAFNPAVDVDD
jgi:hypothetical protein